MIILLPLLFLTSNYCVLFSSHTTDTNNSLNQGSLAFSIKSNFECPWSSQFQHDEKQCGNCQNANNDKIRESHIFANKMIIVERKKNFQITAFLITLLNQIISIGIEKQGSSDDKKKLIEQISSSFKVMQNNWFNYMQNCSLPNHPNFCLSECAYKQECSIYLYKVQKKSAIKREKPIEMTLNTNIAVFKDPLYSTKITTAPKSTTVCKSFYKENIINELFNIFMLSTLPSNRPNSPFNFALQDYFWECLIHNLPRSNKNFSLDEEKDEK